MSELIALLGDEELLGVRYPVSWWSAGGPLELRQVMVSELDAPQVVGVVVDRASPEAVHRALASGKPFLLGVEALAAYLDEGGDSTSLSAARWVPFLPAGLSLDVGSASKLVAQGAIGVVRSCDLTTFVGRLGDGTWECDHPFARSPLEALVFGLDLLPRLCGSVESTRRVSGEPSGSGSYLYLLEAGAVAVHHVLDGTVSPGRLFMATLNGSEGRLLLRHPFARGAVTIWDPEATAHRSPALARSKANVQAPDTVPGGLEVHLLLEGLLTGDVAHLPTPAYGVSLVEQALALTRSEEAG